jgi:hypothetical protein
MSWLLDDVANGNVINIDGKWYMSEKGQKAWFNQQWSYIEVNGNDNGNKAIYPEKDEMEELKETIKAYDNREWVSYDDLKLDQVELNTSFYDGIPKGFHPTNETTYLYLMPSLPYNYLDNPYSGIFDDIEIKVEDGKIYFKHADLIRHGIIERGGFEGDISGDLQNRLGQQEKENFIVDANDVKSVLDIEIGKLKYDIHNKGELSEYSNTELEVKFTNKYNQRIRAHVTIKPDTEHISGEFSFTVDLEPNVSITESKTIIMMRTQIEEAQKSKSFKTTGEILNIG